MIYHQVLPAILLLFLSTVDARLLCKRAGNSYGDELVVPQGGGAQLSENTAPETSETKVNQTVSEMGSVQSSGYRMRRNNENGEEKVDPEGAGAQAFRLRRDNSYGDEMVTPQGGGAQVASAPAEQPAATVSQSETAAESKVQSSGY